MSNPIWAANLTRLRKAMKRCGNFEEAMAQAFQVDLLYPKKLGIYFLTGVYVFVSLTPT